MSILNDKADFSAHAYRSLMARTSLNGEETDGMRLLMLLSGIMVETLLLFDEPEVGLDTTIQRLGDALGCDPCEGPLGENVLPPSYILDYETEQGRGMARELFEDWLDCAYEFHDIILNLTHNLLMKLEQEGQAREETFRLYVECSMRCLAYEISAQELCDLVIEQKIAREGWSLAESVSGLSAVAGRCLALSQNACQLFAIPSLPDKLDQVAYVMTQEATRLGIPAGSDWRFGLAANDCVFSAPFDLIHSLEPGCREFFKVMRMTNLIDQAVACAKAAGRMLAVAASGEEPDLEPVIAKPLAMAAMTDTYRTVCGEGAVLSC